MEPSLVLLRVLSLDEVRHEQSVRDQFQPRESKRWVAIRFQLSEEVSHIKKDLFLRPSVEAVADVDRRQNVNEHAMVGLLVKQFELALVIFVQFDLDAIQDLAHKLLLVELKGFEQEHDQLDERVDEVIIEQSVVRAEFTSAALFGKVDRCTD